MNILGLNDDCLLEIFNYLAPRDLLSMASASKTFSQILPMCKLKTLNVDCRLRFSIEELRFLLENVGGSVLTLSSFGIEHLDSICKYCVNLKNLTIHVGKESIVLFKGIKPTDVVTLIKRLECFDFTSFSDKINIESFFLEPLPKMKDLTISSELKAFDCGVIKAPNLEKFRIEGSSITHFQEFMEMTPKLTVLELTCDRLSEGSKCFKSLPLQLPLLKRLFVTTTITDNTDSRGPRFDVSGFGDLKFLQEFQLSTRQIDMVRNPLDRVLKKWCKHDQLTSLSLTHIPLEVETLEILAKMKNMSNIEIICDELGDEHAKALYYNNFSKITLGDLDIIDMEAFMSLPKQSKNLKRFTFYGIDKITVKIVKRMMKENPNIVILGPLPIVTCSSSSEYSEDEMCSIRKRIFVPNPH